jgi:HlyD family secretion protein
MILFKSFSFYLAIFGILSAIIFSHFTTRPPDPGVFAKKPPLAPFTEYIAATGIIESEDKNIEVGPPEGGVVEKLWFNVGDRVQKGDPLFQIDTRNLVAQLAVQEANILLEQANLQKNRALLERFHSVRDPRSISKEDLQTRQDDVRIAEMKLKVKGAEADETKLLIERQTVRAPKDGIILQQNVREGEYIAPHKPLILIGNVEQLQVRADIDEQNGGYFNQDMPAIAYPKNNSSISIPLKFVRIEPFVIPKQSLTGSSQERVDTRVLQVIYAFTPPKDYRTYVGLQVDVYIEKQNSNNKVTDEH